MADSTHTEIELKLRLPDADAWTSVFAAPALSGLIPTIPQDERLEAWYFDSHDRSLQQAGIAFRIRLENNRWIATVKAGGTSAGGLHKRQEWNAEVPEAKPDISYFQNTKAGPLLEAALGEAPLALLFCTAFDRRTTELTTDDGSRIELAVDRGLIIAGERQDPIAEVELELKQGNPAAVLALGTELAKTVPLVVEPRSKYFRGLKLAGLVLDEHRDDAAEPVKLTDPADAALQQHIIDQIHTVFSAQEDFLSDWQDAETLHQLRIQLRRLRSLLSFAKPLITPESYERWQDELKALSNSLNTLRDADVVIETWHELTGDNMPLPEPAPWLGLLLQAERGKKAKALADSLAKGQISPLLLGLWSFIADRPFATTEDSLSLAEFAEIRLGGWLANMREASKDLSLDNPAQLHHLRISGKKLRYALESLPLRDRKTRLLLARLKKLQDCLGIIRDSQLIATMMGEWMNMHASRVVHRDAGLVLGWSARIAFEQRQEFDKIRRRFRRISRRWLKDVGQQFE
jgi:inorganic triphosphatase YgiF